MKTEHMRSGTRTSSRRSRTPLLISFVGTSGSGKTTAIEYLTAHLTRLGFKVGVAKHIHMEGFTIDTQGKDTWRHARAGARIVIGVSPNELAIIHKTTKEVGFQVVAESLRQQNLDVALLEGFSSALAGERIYKIVAAKNLRDLKYTLTKTTPPILAITGSVSRISRNDSRSSAPLVDVKSEGPLLTSNVRRLLQPRELEQMLDKASLRHGGKCIGLAIGVRAAYISSNAFHDKDSPPQSIICGTKHCIAEAFRTIYPRTRIRMKRLRDDRIEVRSRKASLRIQLAPKGKFASTRQVLTVPDKVLFESVRLTEFAE